MTQHCEPGRHDVPDHEAQHLGDGEWGCHQHVRDLGIVPPAAQAWIGRQDAAPIAPGRRA